MKALLLTAIFAAASALQAAAAHKLPVPLPEFQTPDQLVQWRRETMEKARAADALAASTSPVFYTGKPYLEETGSYAFLFRQYDPELSRWTTTDPSGFPDGANNSSYLENPTSYIDVTGLTGKSICYIYAYTGVPRYDNPSAAAVQSLVPAHTAKLTAADKKNPDYAFISDGDYISYSSISNLSQLSGFSSFDQIYVAAHGVWLNDQWLGLVNIGGIEYQPAQVTAPNLVRFSYCGASGRVGVNEISGSWFFQAQEYLYE